MVALSGLVVAHGGTVGLIGEVGSALAITALMLWALWKNRRAREHDDEGRSDERPS